MADPRRRARVGFSLIRSPSECAVGVFVEIGHLRIRPCVGHQHDLKRRAIAAPIATSSSAVVNRSEHDLALWVFRRVGAAQIQTGRRRLEHAIDVEFGGCDTGGRILGDDNRRGENVERTDVDIAKTFHRSIIIDDG